MYLRISKLQTSNFKLLTYLLTYLPTLALYADKMLVNHTSEANDSRFFSPPDIPRNRPGIPMNVSAHLVRPS